MRNALKNSLFGNIAVAPSERPNPKTLRAKKIQQAFANSDAAFREAYKQFLLAFADLHETFIVEDVTLAYKKSKNIQPRDFRAAGGIVTRMIAAGEIRETGSYRNSVIRCSPMMVYTKGKK